MSEARRVFYRGIWATSATPDGGLRLYRRRRFFRVLRQDVFHPAGEWWSVEIHKDGRCYVLLAERPTSA